MITAAAARRLATQAARHGARPTPAPKRARKKATTPQENLADLFCGLWRMHAPGQPAPKREYAFHEFRFDCAYPLQRVYVELDGWGHKTDSRWRSDIIKGNKATAEGWRGFHYTRKMLEDDPLACIAQVALALGGKP